MSQEICSLMIQENMQRIGLKWSVLDVCFCFRGVNTTTEKRLPSKNHADSSIGK